MVNAAILEGGCLCQGVRYAIHLPIVDAGYCHCRMCQQSSAAPALPWLTIKASQFHWLAGTVKTFASSANALRSFCPECGTPLTFCHPTSALIDVTVVSLDHPESITPDYHIWCASQIDWHKIGDTLPRYADQGPDDATLQSSD